MISRVSLLTIHSPDNGVLQVPLALSSTAWGVPETQNRRQESATSVMVTHTPKEYPHNPGFNTCLYFYSTWFGPTWLPFCLSQRSIFMCFLTHPRVGLFIMLSSQIRSITFSSLPFSSPSGPSFQGLSHHVSRFSKEALTEITSELALHVQPGFRSIAGRVLHMAVLYVQALGKGWRTQNLFWPPYCTIYENKGFPWQTHTTIILNMIVSSSICLKT